MVKKEKIFRMPVVQFPTGYEVSLSNSYYSNLVYRNIHDTLLKEDRREYENLLVENWFTPEENQITVKIRDDIRFSDGSLMTVEDVRDTFLWMLGIPTSVLYNVSIIDSIIINDAQTLDFYSTNSPQVLVRLLSMVGILKSEAISKGVEYLNEHPVSTGVYHIHSKDHQVIVLKKNKYHKMYAKNKTAPDIVELILEPDLEKLYELLLAKKIDFIQHLPLNFYNDVFSEQKYQIIEKESDTLILLMLNAASERLSTIRIRQNDKAHVSTDTLNPLQDIRVRQAIAHVIDIDHFIETEVNSKAYSLVLPMLRHVPGYPINIPWYEYDLEHSRSLMREAGFSEGFEMDIHIIEGKFSTPLAYYIRDCLNKINIDVNVIVQDFSTFLIVDTGNAASIRAFISRGSDTFRSMVMGRFFYNPRMQNTGNFYQNYSPRINEALSQFVPTEDYDAKFYAQCEELSRIIMDEAFIISLLNPFDIYLLTKKFVYQPSSNQINFTDFKIKK